MSTRIIKEAVKVVKCGKKICKCVLEMEPKFISIVDYDAYKICHNKNKIIIKMPSRSLSRTS